MSAYVSIIEICVFGEFRTLEKNIEKTGLFIPRNSHPFSSFFLGSKQNLWLKAAFIRFQREKRMIHSKRIIGLLWATVNMQIKSNEFKFVPAFRHSTRTNWGCKMHLCFIVMQCNLWTWDSSLELKSSFEWIMSVLLVRTNFNCDYISTSSYQILLYDECARPYSFAI